MSVKSWTLCDAHCFPEHIKNTRRKQIEKRKIGNSGAISVRVLPPSKFSNAKMVHLGQEGPDGELPRRQSRSDQWRSEAVLPWKCEAQIRGSR